MTRKKKRVSLKKTVNESNSRFLNEQHLKMLLQESSIDPEVIEERQYKTVTVKAELKRLGFSDFQCNVPALLIPIWNVNGEIAGYHIRPTQPRIKNGKPLKYEFPKGFQMSLDLPPRARDWLGDPKRSLFITEGSKKADSAVSRDLCCIGLIGVWNWRGTNPEGGKTALPQWESIALNDRDVYIVFDSDVMIKRQVYQALERLRSFLKSRKAKVRLIYLPPGEGGCKQGLDDFFANGGTVEKLLEFATTQLKKPSFEDDTIIAKGQYHVYERGIFRLRSSQEEEFKEQLTNFHAKILADIIEDDGVEKRRTYQLEAHLNGSPTTFSIPADRFSAMNWPTEHLGARAILFPIRSGRDHTRTAIQMISNPVSKHVYSHTGWRLVSDEWVFLHADGAIGPIGPEGPVSAGEILLPPALAPFCLPKSPKGKGLHNAILKSLELIELGPDELMIPILSTVYRTVLGDGNLTIFLTGRTGVFKTQLAALAQQHFGSGFDAEHLPASWTSTDNALEDLTFSCKDGLLVIDDFISASHLIDKLHARAERVLRAVGNRSARQRMRPDGSLKPPRPPRCIVLATGEDVPRGHSLRARSVILQVAPYDIDPDKLTECQEAAAKGIYAQALAGFINWVAPNYDIIKKDIIVLHEEFRSELKTPHRRTAHNIASLGVGFFLLVDFVEETNALSKKEADSLWKRGWKALITAGQQQGGYHIDADPVDTFLRLLTALLCTGRAHVLGIDKERPENSDRWGWLTTKNDAVPRSTMIGWVDEENNELLLQPEAAFSAVQKLGQENHDNLPISLSALERRLYERGLLKVEQRGKERRLRTRRTIHGDRVSTLCLCIEALSSQEPAQPDQSAQSTNTSLFSKEELQK